jgi:hypothetical protein
MTCYQLTLSPPSQNWEGVRGRASPHPVGQVIIVIILNLTPLSRWEGSKLPPGEDKDYSTMENINI